MRLLFVFIDGVGLGEHKDNNPFVYTDITGHKADYKEAGHIVKVLDSFISGLAELIKPNEEMLIVTSDHGNLEDVTGKDHTLNLVPLLMVGASDLPEHLAKS